MDKKKDTVKVSSEIKEDGYPVITFLVLLLSPEGQILVQL